MTDPTSSGSEDALISRLVRWEELRRSGQIPDLDRLCADRPDLIDELRRRIAQFEVLEPPSVAGDPHSFSTVGDPRSDDQTQLALPSADRGPESADEDLDAEGRPARYQRVRLHARGGLGEIYLAHDFELNRQVALKRIQERHAINSEARRRFLAEAEITAALQHPGIVPVHSLGRDRAGNAYYTMRFVQGDTLKDAADRSRSHGPPSTVELRALLRRFVDVCNAIAYAHANQVIHRDIKPSNILIGDFGETFLIDWGLAKRIDPAADPSATSAPDSSTQTATGGSGTRDDSTLGTPAFMSPEQAGGSASRIGQPSDIYGLGATLYYLLTGHAPIEAGDLLETLRRARDGQFPRPRVIAPGLPRPLEAICLKAMAKRPEDRYDSALQLAEEVERWLADEPVQVDLEPLGECLARWVRRRRAWAFSMTAALVLVALASVTFAVLIDRSRDQARREAARAERNFELANDAVETYFMRVANSPDLTEPDRPDLNAFRRQLLEDALTYYLRFLEQRGDDQRIDSRMADAYHNIGLVRNHMGLTAESSEAYRRALEIRRALLEDRPDDLDRLDAVFQSATNLAYAEEQLGRTDAAREAQRESETLAERLIRLDPRGPLARERRADSLITRGVSGLVGGRPDEALAPLLEAREILDALLEQPPVSPRTEPKLIATLNRIGVAHGMLGRIDQAEMFFDQARERLERLVALYPDNFAMLTDLAQTLNNLGKCYESNDDYDQAVSTLERSVQIHRRLVRLRPTYLDRRVDLARSLGGLAYYRELRGELDAAAEHYLEALETQERLVADYPETPQHRVNLGQTVRNLGLLANRRGDPERSFALLDRARALLDQAVVDVPDNLNWRIRLVETLLDLGTILGEELSRHGEAADALDRAEHFLQGMAPGTPAGSGYSIEQVALVVRIRSLIASEILDRPEEVASLKEMLIGPLLDSGFDPPLRVVRALDALRRSEAFAMVRRDPVLLSLVLDRIFPPDPFAPEP